MAIVTNGLVLYLHGACGKNNPATRKWVDLSGNGNDGALGNFGYTEDSGWVDGGLKFDGVDDYVNIPHADILNPADGDFTIEVGLKIEQFAQGSSIIIKQDEQVARSNGYSYKLGEGWAGNSLYWFLDDAGVSNSYAYNGIMEESKIYHTVGILDKHSKEIRAYRDTELQMTRHLDYDISNIANEYNIQIGRRFNGTIYYIRLYNRALTDEEILQNYQAGHEWTPQIGKREVTTTMKPITTSLSRKGKGKRELISTMKPITTSLERKGKGTREVISTMKPITASLSRKGVGKREVTTTVKPITASISKKLPPIHAEISTKERNPSITTRERIPKLEVD